MKTYSPPRGSEGEAMSKELIEQARNCNHAPAMVLCHRLADRIEELERDLLNLVCRIHRDGGHYIAKYGEAKAIADADTVAAQNNADLDAMQDDRDEWKARAEVSYKQRDELEREIERKMSAAAFVLKERDALLADNARLREVLVKHVAPYLGHKEVYDEVLASIPAQSLARLRNRVLNKAINVAWNNEPDCNGPIEMALRKLKEPE